MPYPSVSAYIADQPAATRRVLRQLRSLIRKTVPKAEEVISYGVPAYKLRGKPVIYFAGWKEHYSLYPSSTKLVAAFKKELATYELRKGTIRFPLRDPVPVGLIRGIVKFREAEALAAAEAAATRRGK